MLDTELRARMFPAMTAGGMGNPHDWGHLFPPPGFISVDRNNASILAVGTAAGTRTLESIEVTQGYIGWITLVGLQLSNFSQAFFTILRGNVAIRDYVRIVVPLGQADNPKPVFIKINANEPITLTVTNDVAIAGVPVAIRYRLFGWYYPPQGAPIG